MNSEGSYFMGAFFMPDGFVLRCYSCLSDELKTPINSRDVMISEYDYVNISIK